MLLVNIFIEYAIQGTQLKLIISKSVNDDDDPNIKPVVTSSSLEFVRKSASAGDIPPELGVVNYRLAKNKGKQSGLGNQQARGWASASVR